MGVQVYMNVHSRKVCRFRAWTLRLGRRVVWLSCGFRGFVGVFLKYLSYMIIRSTQSRHSPREDIVHDLLSGGVVRPGVVGLES